MGDRHIPIEFANGAPSETEVRLRALTRSMVFSAEPVRPPTRVLRIVVVTFPSESERVRFEGRERLA